MKSQIYLELTLSMETRSKVGAAVIVRTVAHDIPQPVVDIRRYVKRHGRRHEATVAGVVIPLSELPRLIAALQEIEEDAIAAQLLFDENAGAVVVPDDAPIH